MIQKKYKLPYIFGLLLTGGLALTACVAEDPVKPDNTLPKDNLLRAEVTLDPPGTNGISNKARIAKNNEDGYSYGNSTGGAGFQVGDKVGVFARSGNLSKDNGYGPIINEMMEYELTSYTDQGSGTDQQSYAFVSPNMEIYTGAIERNTSVYMYYPYSADMGTYENYVDSLVGTPGNSGYYPDNKTMKEVAGYPLGVKLRQPFTLEDGTTQERCIDLLKMTSVDANKLANGILSGTFYHAFSELILMRGEGFDQPIDETGKPNYDITVVMTKPYTHAQVVSYGNSVQWTIKLLDKSKTEAEKTAATKWQAWKGDNFGKTDKDDVGKEAYYVVIPTGDNSSISPRSEVFTIDLYDNYGNLQHVSSFILNSNVVGGTNNNGQYSYNRNGVPDKKPIYRVRYPLIIAMDEIEPVVRPFTIEDWNDSENNNITDARTKGIDSADDYNEWATAYNTWVKDRNEPDENNELFKYGDYDIRTRMWHFYINGNEKGVIDFTSQQPAQIDGLADVLEGTNALFNITFQNIKLNDRTLFGEIKGKGGIKNINFKNIDVRTSGTEPIGCLAKTISGTLVSNNEADGFIENCNIINGTVIGNGGVGMLAGSMSQGLIRNCTFSGFIMGSSTAGPTTGVLDYENYDWSKILGVTPEAGKIPYQDDVDCNDVLFTNY